MKPELGQFVLAPVRNGDLGRTLGGHVAVIGDERVGGKTFHQSAAFDAADRGAPLMPGKSIGQPRGKGIGGIAPQVLRVVVPVHILLEIELLDGRRFLAVRQAHQHMRQAEPDISRIVALAEHVPLQIGLVVEDLFQIARARPVP